MHVKPEVIKYLRSTQAKEEGNPSTNRSGVVIDTEQAKRVAENLAKVQEPSTSPLFKNASLGRSLEDVENYQDAQNRLESLLQSSFIIDGQLGIYFPNTRKNIGFSANQDSFSQTTQELVIEQANLLSSTIQKVLNNQKIELEEVPEIYYIYRGIQDSKLKIEADKLNRILDVIGNVKIKQDPKNPLLIAFVPKGDSEQHIEVALFKDPIQALNALSQFRKDISRVNSSRLDSIQAGPQKVSEQDLLEIASRYSVRLAREILLTKSEQSTLDTAV